MGNRIEIRLNKTELEQAMTGLAQLCHIQERTGNSFSRAEYALLMLKMYCQLQGVNDLIAIDEETDDIVLPERLIKPIAGASVSGGICERHACALSLIDEQEI